MQAREAHVLRPKNVFISAAAMSDKGTAGGSSTTCSSAVHGHNQIYLYRLRMFIWRALAITAPPEEQQPTAYLHED